jgi:hypothetical protein
LPLGGIVASDPALISASDKECLEMKYRSKLITIEAVSDKPDRIKATLKGDDDDGNWYETFRDWESVKKQA